MGFAGQHGPGAGVEPDSLPADGAPYEEAGLGFDGPFPCDSDVGLD